MNKLQSNKGLVAIGHQLAKSLRSDKRIIDIAEILPRLAERLDCFTAVLCETTRNRISYVLRMRVLTHNLDYGTATKRMQPWLMRENSVVT